MTGGRKRSDRRRSVLLGGAATLVVHALALLALVWTAAPKFREPESAPQASIALLLRREPPRAHPARPAAAAPAPVPRPALTSQARRAAPPTALPSPTPVAPAPTARTGTGAAPAGPATEGDLSGLLRAALGCANRDFSRLTDAERARCDRGFATAARTAPKVDAIPAEKRAYYDAVVKAYEKMRAPMPFSTPHLGDSLGLEERWVGPPGARMPGVGCKIAIGPIPRGAKSYRDKPPNSVKLGKLPCFITPPSGFATEESGVEAPASLRERTDDTAHAAQFDPPKP